MFNLNSEFKPAGDQPQAIKTLIDGLENKDKDQVLLGVTGSGKTFTMANIIKETRRPAVIMAHNKTLAAQLYSEMIEFFPDNAVEYFVSYYDYFQPEAYIPKTDTYIEKDSSINEQISQLRHSATVSLLTKPDVIVVSSVSSIYGLGSPEFYVSMTIDLEIGQEYPQQDLIKKLVELQYERNDIDFKRSSFRVRGDVVDIFPSHCESSAWKISYFGDEIEKIIEFDSLTGEKLGELDNVKIFASSHYVTPRPTMLQAFKSIKEELKDRLDYYYENNMILQAQRLEQRTNFDLEMIHETGACKGIENYSRFLSGRGKGAPPPTLFEYIPKDAILFIDESHVTVPQIGGMYNGDRARKSSLVEHGFRLPSALDNRPLKFEEWDKFRPQTIYVSATPGKFELEATKGVFVEQLIRPTGLVDPECLIRPAENQVDDLLKECKKVIDKNYRVLVTTLTKKMAENLTEYMQDLGIKVAYLHSDVDTLERVEIIQDLRLGEYDVLIGVNLLREGLDIPECGMVAILDADKEGFLRSETALIQTIGRAARNVDGYVILYADKITNSMQRALDETKRRKAKQEAHNKEHNITPESVKSKIKSAMAKIDEKEKKLHDSEELLHGNIDKTIEHYQKEMLEYASNLEFEKAAELRDKITKLEKKALSI